MLQTTDHILLLRAMDLLKSEGIISFEFDAGMSAMHGALPIFPRRLMVTDRDAFIASAILRDNEIA